MVIHRQQPRDMEAHIYSSDGLSSMGERDSADDWNRAHPGILSFLESDASTASESSSPASRPRRACKRIGRTEPKLLQQGPPRRRLGGARRLPASTETRKENRPRARSKDDKGRCVTRGSSSPALRDIRQIPCRSNEPSPETWAGAADTKDGYYDSPLGANWGGEEPPRAYTLSGGFYSPAGEGPVWYLSPPASPYLRRVQPPGLASQEDEYTSRRLESGTRQPLPQQEGLVDEDLHSSQLSFFDLVSWGSP